MVESLMKIVIVSKRGVLPQRLYQKVWYNRFIFIQDYKAILGDEGIVLWIKHSHTLKIWLPN